MKDEQKMRNELRGLWKRDPELFNQLMGEYASKGAAMFPADKRRRTARRAPVTDWVWSKVEFLKWRDGCDVKEAARKLALHGMKFTLYDSPSGTWKVGREERPETYIYSPDGEEPAETIRQLYYKCNKQDDKGMARLMLGEMICAAEGRENALPKDFIERSFPPCE